MYFDHISFSKFSKNLYRYCSYRVHISEISIFEFSNKRKLYIVFFSLQNKSQVFIWPHFLIRTYLKKKNHWLLFEQLVNTKMEGLKVLPFYWLLSLKQMFSITLTKPLHPLIRKEQTCLWIYDRCLGQNWEDCLGLWALHRLIFMLKSVL